MIRGRFRQTSVERIEVEGRIVDLVSHETWARVTGPGFGWGLSYRRPVRVVTDGGEGAPVRDHVMIARAVALIAALLLAAGRIAR